jgi:hypothetical protein
MDMDKLKKKVALLEKRMNFLEAENRRLQKAKDILEIQNVMSMHEYYHAAGRNEEELGDIWAQEAPDVAFEEAAVHGRYVGLEAIREFGVVFFGKFFELLQEEMRKIFADLKDEPGGDTPFGVRIMHTLTTPVIEVAKDGETAKGVWISPGHVTFPLNGKLQAFWHWDRYAVDFIREKGQWKIWHLFVGKDFTAPYEKSWVDAFIDRARNSEGAPKLEDMPGFPKPNAKPLHIYNEYSPFLCAEYNPRPPEPYRTFSETFSY